MILLLQGSFHAVWLGQHEFVLSRDNPTMWSRLALTVCALVQLLTPLPHWWAVHPAVFESDDELV